MKLNENFALREIAGNYVAVPFGDTALDFNGIIKLNNTAKFLWEASIGEFSDQDLIDALIKEYGIDLNTAKEAVDAYIKQMKEAGCIEGNLG